MWKTKDNILTKNLLIQSLPMAGSTHWTLSVRGGFSRRDVTSVITHQGTYCKESKKKSDLHIPKLTSVGYSRDSQEPSSGC